MEIIKLEKLLTDTSPTFCMAKFHEATIWLYNGKIASCHHNPFHGTGNTVETFYNTGEKRNQQSSMLAGEKPAPCSYCWKLEDQGLTSDRRIKSLNYPDHLTAEQYLNKETPFKPTVLELAFSKTCNLGCSYCNADFSTQWMNDIRVNGVYENIQTDSRKHYQRNIESYKDSPVDMNLFWSWLDTVINSLDIIRVTGGEPLLHEETFMLLDYVHNKNPNVKIAINTNLCQKPVLLQRFKDKVRNLKHVTVYTSNESAGETAEFLRDGLDYKEWLDNLASLDDAGLDHIFIMTTINAISLESFDVFLLDIIKIRNSMKTPITVTFNVLTYPEFQSFGVLNQQALDYYFTKYDTFSKLIACKLNKYEQESYKRILSYLTRPAANNQKELAIDFYNFFQQYSIRRSKDFNKREILKFL